MEDVKVYSVSEFSEAMKISKAMAYKLVREHRIRTVKFGDRYLIPASVVNDILSGDCQILTLEK